MTPRRAKSASAVRGNTISGSCFGTRPIPEWWSMTRLPASGAEAILRQVTSSRGRKGIWFASLNAALLSNAMRDRLTDFTAGCQAGFVGDAKTRGGFGAEFCAMTGRYSKGTLTISLSLSFASISAEWLSTFLATAPRAFGRDDRSWRASSRDGRFDRRRISSESVRSSTVCYQIVKRQAGARSACHRRFRAAPAIPTGAF